MTERERAVLNAAFNVGRGHGELSYERIAARFIAMHDALAAYDAAQKPAEPPVSAEAPAANNTAHAEAGGLATDGPSNPFRFGNSSPAEPAAPSSPAQATPVNGGIFRSLPSASRTTAMGAAGCADADTTRETHAHDLGYLEGLEWAKTQLLAASADIRFSAEERRAYRNAMYGMDKEIARIRSGGTTAAPHTPTQAGGAPGLPKGWLGSASMDRLLQQFSGARLYANVSLQPSDVSRLLTMARAAIKLRKETQRTASSALPVETAALRVWAAETRLAAARTLASLETDNG